MSLSTLPTLSLNISRDSDSLGNLFQCIIIPSAEKFFLISNPSFHRCEEDEEAGNLL